MAWMPPCTPATPRCRLALATLALASACAGPRVSPGPPVAPAASAALYEAWRAQRRGAEAAPELQAAGLAAAREAAALEPGWIAPERLIDDAMRADLRGPEALATRLAALESRPDDPVALYLAGRLGGPEADARLDRAAELAPALGWAWHGLAWNAHRRGDTARAVRLGEAAVALARDPHELVHFTYALTRYLVAAERADDAVRVLERLVRRKNAAGEGAGLRPDERVHLAVELALGELSTSVVLDGLGRASGAAADSLPGVFAPLRLRGERRALELLALPATTHDERVALLQALGRRRDVSGDDLVLALAGAGTMDGEDRTAALRGEVLGLRGDSALGAALRGSRDGLSSRVRLTDAFRSGEPAAPLAAWVADLPTCTKDADGAPLRPALARLVEATRAAAPLASASDEARVALADALLGAGWFDEADALALRGALPLDVAREVQRRALAARAGFTAIRMLLEAIDRGEPTELVEPDGARAFDVALRKVTSVDALLVAVERRLLERRVLGGLDASGLDLAASPRVGYGPFAEVVHPGPRFSAEDERLGRGSRGAEVPGLAAEMTRLGRHALFGSAIGQGGPDGAILRLVHVEERAGEHLGRPFRGTVFWCHGADVPPRFARRGASISGAALHEGYWIDLERVEAEREVWRRVARRFTGRPGLARAALDVVGPSVAGDARAALDPALGANDRMRLAWMVERGALEAPALVSLAELAEVVAVHEEGHLCDRAQWYPLRAHLGALLGFAAAHGFSPERIAEALEERAQLVALCCVPDPRLAWIDLLDAAERGGESRGAVTPHAAGYRRLLGRLLARLTREADAGEWPELDPTRRWIDQLHRLDPERLRGLAMREHDARR